jgi:hypothetical protein
VFIRPSAGNRRDADQNFNDIYVSETSTVQGQSNVLMDSDVTKSLQYFHVVLDCLKCFLAKCLAVLLEFGFLCEKGILQFECAIQSVIRKYLSSKYLDGFA